MATKMYLRNEDSGLTSINMVAGDSNVTATPGSLLYTAGAVASNSGLNLGGTTYPTNGYIIGGSPSFNNITGYMSAPVNGFTCSGTITFNFWQKESNMTDNLGAQCVIHRRANDGSYISTVVDSQKGTEFSTSYAVQNWTASPTSTTFSSGDRILVLVMINDAGGTGVASTGWVSVDGPTSGALGDSWVQFTETVTEFVAAQSLLIPKRHRSLIVR